MKYPILIIFLSFNILIYAQKNYTLSVDENNLAIKLEEIGYDGLFLYGELSLCDSIWQNGKNEAKFINIVVNPMYKLHARFLSSEVLYNKLKTYPISISQDTLAKIYSYALGITGASDKIILVGNRWGLLYDTQNLGYINYGDLGAHLINTGNKAIPYLKKLLENNEYLFYEGSKEATIGGMLNYRVKDAAAFYIGQILNIPVKFYDKHIDRDKEIQRLQKLLTNY